MIVSIRKRKDGGCSECSSPDNLVGKGRCIHILTEEKPMEISKISRGVYEVKVNDSTLTINAQKKAITDFFKSLPILNEEKRNNIIKFLEENE